PQQPRRRRPGLLVEPAAAGVRVRPHKPGTGPEARPDRRPSLPSRHTSATPPPPGPRHRGPRRPRAGWYTRRSCQPSLVTLPGRRHRPFAAVLARPGGLPGTVHQARELGGPRLGQGLNDGVSRHRGLLGAVDLVAVRSTWLRHRQPAVPAGRGERDCRAVLLPARSLARASALARTTSGSRGSGGSTSCQGRSRRTLGRWIRICATFLISSASHPSVGNSGGGPGPRGTGPSGPVTGGPGPLGGLFCEGRNGPPPSGGNIPKVTARVELLGRGPPPRGHRVGAPQRARGAGPGRVRG